MSVKAYVVTDEHGEGHATVVFSEQAVVARRSGANELDCEFGDVSCRRATWADHLAPGPVSAKDCIELGGFRYECACDCGRMIDNAEGYSTDHDDDESNAMDPVYDGDGVYWNQRCKDSDDQRRRERKDKAARDQSEVEMAVLAKWPFATEISAYRGYSGGAGSSTYDVLHASFRFPGGNWPARWGIGAETISITPIDLDAWNALTKKPEPEGQPA